MGLDTNMKAAVTAAGAVRLKVPQSANYAFTSSAIKLNNKPLPLHTTTNTALAKMRETLQTGEPVDTAAKMWSLIQTMAATAVKAGIGNCGETAAVAMVELVGLGVNEPIEYVYVVDGVTMNAVVPHVFAVIGRSGGGQESDWGADIGLPSTWGNDAVVCDPWDRVAYPGAQHDFFWAGLRKHSQSANTLTCKMMGYVM